MPTAKSTVDHERFQPLSVAKVVHRGGERGREGHSKPAIDTIDHRDCA